MRTFVVLGIAAALGLAGCHRKSEGADGGGSRGRYAGIGTYPAGGMWKQLVAPKAANYGAARLSDDEQIIVVVDSRTGEIRQCGNLSGYCIGMSPWAAQVAGLPAALAKHAADIQAEDAARLSGGAPKAP